MPKKKIVKSDVFNQDELAVINKAMDYLYKNDGSLTEKDKSALVSSFQKIRRIAKGSFPK